MRLVSLLEHMKNQKVSVNGTEYPVDANGEAYVGNQADARALLANASGWMVKPDPLMPLGDDGEPEHLYVPPKYKMAPPVQQDPTAQARLDRESPVLTPNGPAQSATAGPMGAISPGPFGQGTAQAGSVVAPEPDPNIWDLRDTPVTPDDIIAAAQPPKSIAVSSPTAPADARVGTQTKPKKGSRK